MSTRTRSVIRVLCGVALAASGLMLAPAAAGAGYAYSGGWGGAVTTLTHVANVTVEGLPDARLAGVVTNFQTGDPRTRA